MSSPDQQHQNHRGIDWPAIVRILLLQVVVLLALAGAFIGYVDWSSERAFSEFMSVGEPTLASADRPPQSSPWVRTVKAQPLCPRKD